MALAAHLFPCPFVRRLILLPESAGADVLAASAPRPALDGPASVPGSPFLARLRVIRGMAACEVFYSCEACVVNQSRDEAGCNRGLLQER